MRGFLIGLVASVACVPGGGTGGASAPLQSDADKALFFRLEASAAARPSRLLQLGWRGGRLTAATGEQVTIQVSDSYAPEAVSPQWWADFFAALVHGDEIGRVIVRIARPAEVAQLCGPDALGCYARDLLVMPGEMWEGVTPEEIARHEYGHHVAANRSNAPWHAADWGTKRWASLVGICARTAAGQLFPAGGGFRYSLAPGEGFAEAYRVLNERRAGTDGIRWSIVDQLFFPAEEHLEAIERDVLQPWSAPTVRMFRMRFVPGGSTKRRLRLLAPLDGTLTVSLTLPRGRFDELELIGRDGTVLARGLWGGTRTRRLSYDVCGQRTLTLRITRHGQPGPFALSVTAP